MDIKLKHEINELLYLTLEGMVTREQVARLDSLIAADPEVLSYCVDFYVVSSLLRKTRSISDVSVSMTYEANEQYRILQEMGKVELVAPAIESREPEDNFVKIPVEKVKIQKVPRKINKPFLYTAILSTAALLFMVVYVKFYLKTPSRVVATLTDAIDVQWLDSSSQPAIGQRLRNFDGVMRLRKGLVEIQFEYGAQVIIEGPAEFELQTPEQMYLSYGRVYSVVPESAAGFIIETPNSKVSDLGTEFGVKVDWDGMTDVHMFKGKASIVPGVKGQASQALILTQGHSVTIDNKGGVREVENTRDTFVRYVSSGTGLIWRGQNINLADITGGGNGLGTGTLGGSIDPETGLYVSSPVFGKRNGTGGYKTVSALPFIDGVFVPDGGEGPVQVSSEKHYFENCPDTTKAFYTNVTNGGRILNMNDRPVKTYCPMVLDGTEYGSVLRPAMIMHSNLGITFDMEAIRTAIPQARIVSFRSLCGIADHAPTDGANADFYVLIDGKVRFQKQSVLRNSGATLISVDIDSQCRFLTLVTTDQGGYGDDYCFFAEPTLVLE